MQITAVITTYKRSAAMVERAILSVINQTFRPLEIIVVDDSTPDYAERGQVKKMAEGYAEQGVVYVQTEGNLGACAARNIGLSMTNGEYIAFLDDDDEWLPTKIEKQAALFTSEDIALVYCGSYTVDDENGLCTERQMKRHRGYVHDELMLKNFIESTSFPLIRVSALREIGGFDNEMPACQDLDVWIRLTERYAVDYVDEPLVRYHVHSGERITKNHQKKVNGIKRLMMKNAEYLASHKRAVARFNLKLVMPYILNGNKREAFVAWCRAVGNNIFDFKSNFRGFVQIIKGALGAYK